MLNLFGYSKGFLLGDKTTQKMEENQFSHYWRIWEMDQKSLEIYEFDT